jgi:hypothetical protein
LAIRKEETGFLIVSFLIIVNKLSRQQQLIDEVGLKSPTTSLLILSNMKNRLISKQ